MNSKLLLGAAILAASLPAYSSIWTFSINASGGQVVPGSGSNGTGTGLLTYDDATNLFSLDMTMTGIAAPSATDIIATQLFAGPSGANGTLVDDLTVICNWNGSNGNFGLFAPVQYSLNQAHEQDLLNGNTYLLVSTTARSGGEIRGQFTPVPEPASLAVVGLGLIVVTRKRRRN